MSFDYGSKGTVPLPPNLAHAMVVKPPADVPLYQQRWDVGVPASAHDDLSGAAPAVREYAEVLGCPRVHVMSGVGDPDDRGRRLDTYRANLAWAAGEAAGLGVDLLVEALNPRDVPSYLIARQEEAHALVRELGLPNVGVQLDLYHLQVTEGDVTVTLRRDVPTGRVHHLQIAGVPDRREPDSGELDVAHVCRVVDESGFDGWVGCEYAPRAGTSEGLGWIRRVRGTR